MTRRAMAWIGCWLALTVAAVAQEPAAQESGAEGEALPPWRRMLEGDDAERAEKLAARSAERADAGDYVAAIAAAEELLALRERVQGAHHWEAVTAKWQIDTLQHLAALSAAERRAWRAAWRAAWQGGQQAGDLQQRGRYAEAQPFQERLLEVVRKFKGEEHLDTAPNYSNLALNLSAQGKYAEAHSLFQQALDIFRRVLGEEHPNTATSYDNLAFNLHSQGRYAEAHPLNEKALDIRRRVLGEEHPDTARSYSNLAVNLNSQGKYAEAHPLIEKALDIRRRVLGEENPDTATSYNNLAANLNDQGRYAEAHPLYEQALGIHRRVGEENPHTATTYSNLAANLNAQGKYAEAHPLLEKALDIRRRVLGEENPDTALSYNNLAVNLHDQGKYAEAHPLYVQALDIRSRVLGEEHPNTATSYSNLAANLYAQSRYAEAVPLFQRALDIDRRVLGEGHPNTVASYNNLAFNLHAQGKYAEALVILHDAAAAYEAARMRVAASGLERAVVGADQSPYRLLAAVQARAGRWEDVWRALEADLARGLLDEAGQRAGVSLTPEEGTERQELLAGLARIEPQILQLVTTADPTDDQREELDALLAERSVAEGRLADLAAALSQREVAALADVQAALPSDAAFIAWVDVAEASGVVQEHWGCVLRASGLPAWERLPGTGPEGAWTEGDSKLPEQLREALAPRDSEEGSQPATAAEIAEIARRLAAQRIAPLDRHLEGVRRLYVAAVHEMAGVPVDVLTDRYTVSYTPSGTQLARLKAQERPGGPPTLLALGDAVFDSMGREAPVPTALPPGGLLIRFVTPQGNAAQAGVQSGDVLIAYASTELESIEQLRELVMAHAVDESVTVTVWRENKRRPAEREVDADKEFNVLDCKVRPGKLDVVPAQESAREAVARRREIDTLLTVAGGRDWKDLPGTRFEVAQLVELFDRSAATILLDSDASEQQLEVLRESGELVQYRYLHLATHGESVREKAFESALILALDQLPPVDESAAGAPFDGRLTAGEVLEKWKLNADLVTLSACQSGLGREGGGEGFLGFSQALLLAGSRSVCLSLWNVDDTATALLMDRFYQNLLGKREDQLQPMPKAEALAEAKQWLRTLSVEEVTKLAGNLNHSVDRGGLTRAKNRPPQPELPAPPKATAEPNEPRPYAHPHYWAAFVLIGEAE